jgi:hypothetical protein
MIQLVTLREEPVKANTPPPKPNSAEFLTMVQSIRFDEHG